MSKVTFDSNQTYFFKLIKEKTDQYFITNNLHTSGNTKLYVKGAIQVLSACILYLILVFFTPTTSVALLLCCLLGFNLAVIGFNVMHEGGHQSFSKYSWLNNISAYFLNVLGGNSYFWKIKHNINHHTYTNIDGLDSDIDVQPFMRLHENQPRHWFHRFQHVYWVFLYGISYVAWVFYEDFEKYFTRKISANSSVQKLKLNQHAIFWLTKILYVGVYIILPVIIIGWVKTLVGFAVITFICGLTTSVVFQLAHAVEGTSFVSPDKESNTIRQEWAVHQVTSTANFATQNKVFFWLLGGLNFQIEHHLFPRISHIHYPQISRFVKEACKEYNIVYHEHSTLLKAFFSHLLYLKRLGIAS
jgi:linoleoyl-CoA desaturase